MRLKTDWANFKLFLYSDAIAKQFAASHEMIASSLFDSVVLQLTRLLTDPLKMGGSENLTIERVAKDILNVQQAEVSIISRIKRLKSLRIVRDLEKKWRHKRLAHNDYATALRSTVPPVKIDEVDRAIQELAAIFVDLGKELNISYNLSVEDVTIPSFAEDIARLGLERKKDV